ncbi:hypothetical protein ATCC90586_006429 [Pythium insidiosum]|nr:hypothetical protein ATCC90586_006429 [Pythium insidiosum]
MSQFNRDPPPPPSSSSWSSSARGNAPPRAIGRAITCRNCGCLNFSSEPICPACQQLSAAKAAPMAHAAAAGRPTAAATPTPTRTAPPPLPSAASSSAGKAQGRPAASPVGTRINPPGSAVVSNGPSTTTATAPSVPRGAGGFAPRGPPSRPAPLPKQAHAASSSSVGADVAAAGKRRPARQEVIDLVSSDEDDEEAAAGRQRPSLQSDRGNGTSASQHTTNRLALKDIHNSPTNRSSTAQADSAIERVQEQPAPVGAVADDQDLAPGPHQSRCFPTVEFNPNEFPDPAAEALNRGRKPKQEPVADLPPPAAATTAPQAMPPPASVSMASVSIEAPSTTAPPATTTQPAPVLQPKLERPTKTEVLIPQASSNSTAIDLVDSDDDGDEETGPALFQSRRFPEIAFHASDFISIQDGLNVARRSGLVYRPLPEERAAVNGNQDETRASASASPVIEATPPSSQSPRSTTAQPTAFAGTRHQESPTVPQLSPSVGVSASTSPRRSNVSLSGQAAHATLTSPLRSIKPEQPSAAPPRAPQSKDSATDTASTVHTLQPRRKTMTQLSLRGPAPLPSSSSSSSRLPSPTSVDRVGSVPAAAARPFIRRIGLGHCGSDFLEFAKHSVDGDEEDEEEDDDEVMDDDEEEARARLLEIVDLTNLSDDSADDDDEEDDDDDDGFAVIEVSSAAVSTKASAPDAPPASALSAQPVLNLTKQSLLGLVAPAAASSSVPLPLVKKRRAPRPKETCMLCEEKGWIRSLVHCATCKKFYHRRCARDFGDADVCWNCDLDGMIDDSELTDGHKEEVVSMFSTLRQSSDSEQEEDARNSNKDGSMAGTDAASQPLDSSTEDLNGEIGRAVKAALQSQTTRSMRRWKEFLEKATARVDAQFEATTSRIQVELEQPTERARYSKGFASREAMQEAMAQVMDHYAELQEREERSRGLALEAITEGDSESPSSAMEAPPGSAIAMELSGERAPPSQPTTVAATTRAIATAEPRESSEAGEQEPKPSEQA